MDAEQLEHSRHVDHRTRSRLLVTAAAAVAFGALVLLERKWPLRRRVESRVRRTGRNLTIVAITAVVTTTVERLLLEPVLSLVERRRYGLLQRLPVPAALRTVLAVLLLDYTLWWWHWMNHRIRFFWRFHLVHHVDLDLDASTALRFHFGEMALSVPYRALQVLALGIDRRSLGIWQRMLIISVIFHHSNLRLPASMDRTLTRLIVTPRMHGIHHSDWLRETDSNWSSLLSWWDWLHGTIRLDIPQQMIRIGVPAWQDAREVTLGKALAVPFREQREDWRRPDGVLQIRRPPRLSSSEQ